MTSYLNFLADKYMKKAIKCLFSLIFISNLNAQENSIEIPNIHTLHSIHRINDTVDFVIARMNSQNASEFSLFKFDKSNNTFDSLGVIPSNLNNSPFIITNEGVALSTRFYQGNDLFHRVYWIGLDGQIVEAGNFNSIRLLAKQNEFVYFSVAQPSNSFQLRRLNITTGTVSIIANTEHEFMFQLPDTSAVFFAARNPQGNLSILKYENGVDLQTLLNSELPVSLQFSHYRGFFDNKYFISQSSQYWEISLNPVELNLFGSIPTIPYQFNTYHTLPDSVFYTQRWEFIQFYGPKYYVVKGSIHNNILDTIPFSSALSPYRPRIESFIDGKYANGYTYKHGSEIFMITDSVYLVSDLAPGIQNGRLGGIFHKLNTDSSIVSMTNRMDSLVYLYALNDSLSQSYYPITYEGSLSATRYFDNYLYWYYVHENKFIIKYRSLLENFSPQPTEQEIIDNDVWARNLFYVHETSFSNNINQTQQLSNIKLLEDGSVIVATRAADSHQYKIVDENYHVIDDAFGGFILYKLDFQGNLIWHYSSGAQHYGSFADYPIIWDTDAFGDIYITGGFFKDYYFEDDTMSVDRCANFIIKIDGQTGEKIWFKIFSETFYMGDIHIDQMKIHNDQMYITFLYTGFSRNIDGVTISNNWASPINAIAKFDLSGNVIFAKNIPTEWTNNSGRSWMLDFENDNAVVVQAQGAYNWSSSCEFDNWGYFNQVLDLNGNVKNFASLYSSDLGSVQCGFLKENDLYAFGYYRGTLDLGFFDYTTPPHNNCNRMRGFMYCYDIEKGFKEMKISNDNFFPFAAKQFDQHYYVYGRGENNELTIVKFSMNGDEIGYKPIGQNLWELTFNAYQQFDVNNDFIAISGDMFKENQEYLVPRPVSLQQYVTIIKTRNNNWLNDKKIFKNVPRNIQGILGDSLVVYPNPSDGIFNLMFEIPIYDEVQVYDVSGHLVFSMTLNDDEIQTIDLLFLAQGIYMLRLFNSEESRTIRVMKN